MNKVKTESNLKCPICGKRKNRKGNLFLNIESLNNHIKTCKKQKDFISKSEYLSPAEEMADLIAGDESDGVYWGIVFEHGGFG